MYEEPCGCTWDGRASPVGRAGLVYECDYHARVERHAMEQAREILDLRAKLAELERERERTTALRAEVTSLGEAYDAEMDFRAEMRRELGADDSEGFDQFLRRVHRELATLRDRYRPRRQSEEPAPLGKRVLMYDSADRYWRPNSWTMLDNCWWFPMPPAPSEG